MKPLAELFMDCLRRERKHPGLAVQTEAQKRHDLELYRRLVWLDKQQKEQSMANKTPPFAGRKPGDRCTEKLVPPFHDGRDPKSYRTSSGPVSEWVERDGASYKLREDGRVDVFSPAGYQVVDLMDLPQPVIDMLKSPE